MVNFGVGGVSMLFVISEATMSRNRKLGRDSGVNNPGAKNSGLGRSPPTFRYLPPQNSDNVKDTTQLTLQVVRQVLCHKETAAESTSWAMRDTT